MENKAKRHLLNLNPYQLSLIAWSMLPTLFICLVTWLIADIIYFNLIKLLVYKQPMEVLTFLENSLYFVYYVLWGFFSLLIFAVINQIKRRLGAWDRLCRTIDTILAEKRKITLSIRKGDNLPPGLLERINALIDQLPFENRK